MHAPPRRRSLVERRKAHRGVGDVEPVRANLLGIPIISAMGAGNKLDPTRFQVADIAKTSVCPLCRVMRTQLKKRGIAHHRVVFSTEEPLKIVADESNGRHAPGSVSFVPPVVGMIMAGEIVKNIVKGEA